MCDRLVVGVSTDDLVFTEKKKTPVIPFIERCEVVQSCEYVDVVIPQEDRDKTKMCNKLKVDMLFVGDDWYDHSHWNNMEEELQEQGVRIIYFPYTKGTSSTIINSILTELRDREI